MQNAEQKRTGLPNCCNMNSDNASGGSMRAVSVSIFHVTAMFLLYGTWGWSKQANVANMVRPVLGVCVFTGSFPHALDPILLFSQRRQYMVSMIMEYDSRCTTCCLFATPRCLFGCNALVSWPQE